MQVNGLSQSQLEAPLYRNKTLYKLKNNNMKQQNEMLRTIKTKDVVGVFSGYVKFES